MSSITKVTPGIFISVKELLKAGSTNAEVAQYLHLARNTVTVIDRSETYEEYKNNMLIRSRQNRAKYAKKAEKEKEPVPQEPEQPQQPQEVVHRHEQSVTIVANHYMAEELRKQTELLNLINNKLGAIIDDLYGTGKKEG